MRCGYQVRTSLPALFCNSAEANSREETAFCALASIDRSAEPTSARLTATASFSATAPVSRTAAAPDLVALVTSQRAKASLPRPLHLSSKKS